MSLRYLLVSLTVALVGVFAAYFAGIWPMLGGHPYWSQSVTYIGAAIGVVLFLGVWLATEKLRWSGKYLAIAIVALMVIAFIVSTLGKREFVGSYAENRMAGRFWYYGFTAFIAALFTSAAIAVQALQKGKR